VTGFTQPLCEEAQVAKAALFEVTDAVAAWRDRALLADTALFSDDPIWTMVNLRSLWVALTQDKSDSRRLESLGEQLRNADREVVCLAAELYWLMYLGAGPACISHARKTDIVRTIYEWSGQTLPLSHPLLKEPAQELEGSPGLFFSAQRSEELFFLIKAVVGIKKHGRNEREALLSEPWEVGRLFDEAAGNETPQLNHMLRYLLFPDHYEAVFAQRDKRRIVESFSGIPRKEAKRWSVTRLDEELNSIRKQLEELYDEQSLSFLREPLVETWRQSRARGSVPSSEQRFWVEKSAVSSQPDRESGPNSVGRALWSPRQKPDGDDTAAMMREVEPGDVVFHLTDNAGITGVSLVDGEIEEDFVCPEESRWPGQPGFRISLTDFTNVTPMLAQSKLLLDPRFQDELRGLADKHRSLFFNRQLTLNRGCYLTDAPEELVRIFNEVHRQASNRHLPHVTLPDPEDLPSVLQEKSAERVQHPLAHVLSGATGTGKTYTAMVRAVEICDGTASSNHDQLMHRFNELQADGRIQLVTFHPSFSYQDFIERRLREPAQEESEDEGAITDRIKPGVFKSMAEMARTDVPAEEPSIDLTSTTVWKTTPFPEDAEDDSVIYQDLIERQIISSPTGGRIDFSGCNTRAAILTRLAEGTGEAPEDDTVSTVDQLVNQMKTGDLVILADNEARCRAVGRITGNYRSVDSAGQRPHFQTRSVQWLYIPDEPLLWDRIARKAFLSRSLYRMDGSLLRVDEFGELIEPSRSNSPNYVLIIDEIGRGDVAQVFGELVTLIEPDKRSDGKNALSVALPLSGESFSVPGNLYIIGTLNSAEPINPTNADILHRRFRFDELSPDASLIRGDDQLGTIEDGEGGRIDLRSLMLTINRRIEYLAGSEHRLGQGFFMSIRTYDDLLHAIRSRVLPHLKSVFEDDWRQIQLIFKDLLSDGKPNEPQVIGHEDLRSETVLGLSLNEADLRTRFWVTTDRELTPDAFRKVYSEF
jgi:hypothetical protein